MWPDDAQIAAGEGLPLDEEDPKPKEQEHLSDQGSLSLDAEDGKLTEPEHLSYQGSPRTGPVIGAKQAARAADRGRLHASRALHVQAPMWASHKGQVMETKLQQLCHGRTSADQNPRPNPAPQLPACQGKHPGLASRLEADSDSGGDSHDDSDGDSDNTNSRNTNSHNSRVSKQPFAHLEGSDSVARFLVRLHKPTTTVTQQQQLSRHLQQQDCKAVQRQQQQRQQQQQQQLNSPREDLSGHHATALQLIGYSLPQCAAAHSSRASASAQADVETPLQSLAGDAQQDAAPQAVLWGAAGSGAMSPVQAAVSAVVGRLESVQLGLASAEGRLAFLTGKQRIDRQVHCICPV